MKVFPFALLIFFITLISCDTNPQANEGMAQTDTAGELASATTPEITTADDDWQDLLEEDAGTHWRNFKKDGMGSSWKFEDGVLSLDAQKGDDGKWKVADGGDIITKKTYEDFELELEWKIGECGNSGIMFNVVEDKQYDYVWRTGPEMQILDNSCHPDAKIVTHRAGDLYDLIESSEEMAKPAGEWNKVRIKLKDGQLEQWLNGTKVVATTLWDDAWNTMVAGSKFKDMPDFGKATRGHISLQDHSDPVSFRNIRIREI